MRPCVRGGVADDVLFSGSVTPSPAADVHTSTHGIVANCYREGGVELSYLRPVPKIMDGAGSRIWVWAWEMYFTRHWFIT